jgi:hypothetical protein
MPQTITNERSIPVRKLSWLLRIVGVIQIALGVLYLVAPGLFLRAMGHSTPEADIYYPLAMLAARFIAYGAALIYIAASPLQYRLWIYCMVLIQAIDLAAGLFYTARGIVPLSLSGFPMFNALWIIALLLWWRPRKAA